MTKTTKFHLLFLILFFTEKIFAVEFFIKPEIANYPFTTLHPILGVVDVDQNSYVLADIPGLIEGAHKGSGLGDRFLGHIERCNVLLHLVDGTEPNVIGNWQTVRKELTAYGQGLSEKFCQADRSAGCGVA